MTLRKVGPNVITCIPEAMEWARVANCVKQNDGTAALQEARDDAYRLFRWVLAETYQTELLNKGEAGGRELAYGILSRLGGYRHKHLRVSLLAGVPRGLLKEYLAVHHGAIPALHDAGVKVVGWDFYSGSIEAEDWAWLRDHDFGGCDEVGFQAYWTREKGMTPFNAFRWRGWEGNAFWLPGDKPLVIPECGEDEVRDGPNGTYVGKPGWQANGTTEEQITQEFVDFDAAITPDPAIRAAFAYAVGAWPVEQWGNFELRPVARKFAAMTEVWRGPDEAEQPRTEPPVAAPLPGPEGGAGDGGRNPAGRGDPPVDRVPGGGVAPSPPQGSAVTPMHKRMYLWQFDQLGEKSVAEIAATLRLGGITEIACKTHQATNFIGNGYDTSPLAFRAFPDVRRRFEEFKAEGIRMVPWCVPMGLDVWAEADFANAVAAEAEGLIELDVEPYEDFWVGPKTGLAAYVDALTVRYEVNFDARPIGWQPFPWEQFKRACDGAEMVWTQTYWRWFQTLGDRRSTEEIVGQAVAVLDGFGVPTKKRGVIFGYEAPDEFADVAGWLSEQFGVRTIGLWKMGDAGLAVYEALAAIPTLAPDSAPVESGAPATPDLVSALDDLWQDTKDLAALDHERLAVQMQTRIIRLKEALGLQEKAA